MKAYLRQLLTGEKNPLKARCLLREYLQARLLESFQAAGVFIPWAFQGGTALRFLYSIPRFSEDLDFALVTLGVADGFQDAVRRAQRDLAAENYAVRVKVQAGKIVKAAWFNFDGLLHELGQSPLRSEVLSIKIELDTNPPAGAGLATSIVRRHIMLRVQHHDPASLLAGKLHAVLERPYTKGRDLYDLAWYLADRSWPAPNTVLLNNALAQSGWSGPRVTEQNWKALARKQLSQVNWKQAVLDIRPFLEREKDVQWITLEHLTTLLEERPPPG